MCVEGATPCLVSELRYPPRCRRAGRECGGWRMERTSPPRLIRADGARGEDRGAQEPVLRQVARITSRLLGSGATAPSDVRLALACRGFARSEQRRAALASRGLDEVWCSNRNAAVERSRHLEALCRLS